MKIFESFNFDIIIILILISSIITGLYFNLYRQGRRTAVLTLPIIILFFLYNFFYDSFSQMGFLNNSINKILEILKIKHQETAFALIIYFISYILLGLAVRLIYSLFRVKVQKRVLNKSSTSSRILGSVFGLLNGYVIGMLLMFVLNPFIGLNYDKPITKIYTETSNDVLTFTSVNQLKNVNVRNFENIQEVLGELTGRNALNQYIEILDIFKTFEDIEQEFISSIKAGLTVDSAGLINDEDFINSFYENKDKILENEKASPNRNRLRDIVNYLTSNKIYLTTYNSISDHDFITVSNYLITNEEQLLTELTKKLHIDNYLIKVNTFKSYLEKRDEHLSLIDYVTIDIKEDVLYFEKELAINTDNVISSYNEKYQNNDSNVYGKISLLFNKYNKNKEMINNLNSHLSFSAKITLIDRYNNYFVNNGLFKNKLLKSYIIDVITNKELSGYELYSEYIFYSSLANGIDLDELSKDEFLIILNNLSRLVNDNILSKEQANRYFLNLFTSNNNVFFGLLTENLIIEIKTIENEFLSEEFYALIS